MKRANRGREPERLRLKYRAMRRDPFVFFRGTCPLFFQDARPPSRAPLAWISGDLHLENFGSFHGDNGLVYFDVNDFDEAALAPCTWDLARFVTSVLLGGSTLGLDAAFTTGLARAFLDAYREALRGGKARWLERATARGAVRALLRKARRLTRRALIARRTDIRGGRRRLRLGPRAMPLEPGARALLAAALRNVRAGDTKPRFGALLDASRRVAGSGSLGLRRYVVLARGPRGGRPLLLDCKEARPSALGPYLTAPQPRWPDEAHRVVAIQSRVQAAAPALLRPVRIGATPFVLRELQPFEDRLALEQLQGRPRRLEGALLAMGEVVAWGHLRSAGRERSAITDEWIRFANRRGWDRELLAFGRAAARRTEREWREFRAAVGPDGIL